MRTPLAVTAAIATAAVACAWPLNANPDPYVLVWKNSKVSCKRLNHGETERQLEARLGGRRSPDTYGWQTLFQEEMESRADVVSFAGCDPLKTSHSRWVATAIPTDPRGLAAWTRQRLDANVALPQPVVNQLACCLYGAGYADDFNQAKAMAAVDTGSLAA